MPEVYKNNSSHSGGDFTDYAMPCSFSNMASFCVWPLISSYLTFFTVQTKIFIKPQLHKTCPVLLILLLPFRYYLSVPWQINCLKIPTAEVKFMHVHWTLVNQTQLTLFIPMDLCTFKDPCHRTWSVLTSDMYIVQCGCLSYFVWLHHLSVVEDSPVTQHLATCCLSEIF